MVKILTKSITYLPNPLSLEFPKSNNKGVINKKYVNLIRINQFKLNPPSLFRHSSQTKSFKKIFPTAHPPVADNFMLDHIGTFDYTHHSNYSFAKPKEQFLPVHHNKSENNELQSNHEHK